MNKDARTGKMYTLYKEAIQDALRKVSDRMGRNDGVALPDMFGHGAQTAIDIVYMKACRCLGEDNAEVMGDSTRGELIDIINYAAFAVALYDMQKEDA